MKRCWVCLLALLLIAALVTMGAIAEEDGDLMILVEEENVPEETSAGDVEIVAEDQDEEVREETGLLLDEMNSSKDEENSSEDEASNTLEDVVLTFDEEEQLETDPVERTMDGDEDEEDDEDFEIVNGVLVKYNGAGGDVVIPEGVTSIGEEAFYGCSSLTSVTIPDGVTSIGDYAFFYCKNLTSITLPNSVTSIGEEAFYYCSSLTSVTIPDGVTSIGEEAFYYCSRLTSIALPAGVTEIRFGTFLYSGLKSIVVPDSITKIDSYAFYACKNLTSIVIPDSVTEIGNDAFSGCTNLSKVKISNSVTDIDSGMFLDCTSLTDIVIPKSVAEISASSFENCTSLSKVTIKGNVGIIGDGAFAGCTRLASIVIPDGIFYISTKAFSDCKNLKKVTIGRPLPDSYFYKGQELPEIIDVYSFEELQAVLDAIAGQIIIDMKLSSLYPGHPINNDAFVGCPKDITFYTQCETSPSDRLKKMGYSVVKAKHQIRTIAGIEATYTEPGLTEGKWCPACGTILTEQKEIPKLKFPKNGVRLTKNATRKVKAGAKLQIVLDGVKAKSYKSDKTDVATVSKKGLVTAKLAGTAKITVMTEAGKKLVLTLKVSDAKAPKKISFTKGKNATLKKGKKLKLKVKLKPSNARYALTWSTSDKSVATVSKKGVVKAKKKGKADITVETQNGKKAKITITVE